MKWFLLFIFVLSAFSLRLSAQLNVAVVMQPNPSPYISDWKSNPNTVLFIVTNPTNQTRQVRFDGYIIGDRRGKVAEVEIDAAIPPVIIPPGSTSINAVDAHLLDDAVIRFIGSSKSESERSGRLPEDHFRLCVRLMTYDVPHTALSPEMCGTFEIAFLQPPSLIFPTNASEQKSLPTFQWSIIAQANMAVINYELTLIDLEAGQGSPGAAMQNALPLLRRTTTVPVYVLLQSDPQLVKGRTYAWRVRAFDQQKKYSFVNDGYSEIWTFVYNPVIPPPLTGKTPTPVGSKEVDTKKIVPSSKTSATTGFKYIPMTELGHFLLINSTVKGRLYYTFEKSKLFHEHKIGSPLVMSLIQSQNTLNPLPNVVVRLVKQYKTIPSLNFMGPSVYNTTTGKTLQISKKTVATTTTDANGNFTFNFSESDSTVIWKNANMRSGGGEFVDYVENATMYKYYTVEVVNPYYCSSGHEITCDPGQTTDLALSSMVRTYNLDVTVKDKEQGTAVGSVCNVYIARQGKNLMPLNVPDDEGELEPGSSVHFQAFQPVDLLNPSRKFTNNQLGYVIGMRGTEDAPAKGHVILKRLVRNVGGADYYVLSARTPEKKLDGNYNDLYYFDNNKGVYFSKSTQYDPQGQNQFLYDPNFSEEIVYNTNYQIPTFTTTINIIPRLPRLFGRVKRSDSKKDIENCVVRIERTPAEYFNQDVFYDITNKDGLFVVNNIKPSGTSWSYNFRFLTYGFNTYEMKNRAVKKGYQMDLGTIELDPKLIVTRTVVDEQAKPLPGVEGVLGDGTKRYTNEKGVFLSPAIPGYQPFHLEKKPKYADKDTTVIIQDNVFEALGALLVNKIVMFEAKRRLEVRVVNQKMQPIQGAIVVLEDKQMSNTGNQLVSWLFNPFQRITNEQGVASFAYLSPSSEATISISVPNSDYVSTKRTFTDIQENGSWTKRMVIVQAGGRIKGIVYIGDKKATGGMSISPRFFLGTQQSPPTENNLPCANARVWVEGYPNLKVFTNNKGEFDLRGVPVGSRIIRAARSTTVADSQAIGAEKNILVSALQEYNVNLYLTKYAGMDITKLLGFPIEIDQLKELTNGNIKIDGAFVNVPGNSFFALKNAEQRFEFVEIELTKYGSADPPPAKPVMGSVRMLGTNIELRALAKYPTQQHDAAGIAVQPVGNDFTKGRFNGKCVLLTGSFSINSNELTMKDVNGKKQDWYLAVKNDNPGQAPVTLLAALTSDGSFNNNGADLRISDINGNDPQFKLNTYNTTADAKNSTLTNTGVHLPATVHVTIDGCGSSMSSSCDLPLQIGEVLIKQNGLEPINPANIAAQDIPLQMWNLHAQDFGLNENGYFTFKGSVKAPLVQNVINDETTINVPFTGMQLRPTEIWGGTFSFSTLDLLGIAAMDITNPAEIGSDSQSWFLTTKKPEIRADQGGGKVLEGLNPAEKIVLNTFYLRSDGTKSISASEDPITLYKVGSFALNTFQFGYDSKPYMSMQGSLTLIGIPDLSPQFTRIYYTPGRKFGMDGVFFAEPYIAGGVKLTVANGLLTPDGFIAEGDWGMYKNQIILEGQYKLNMWFRHRKIGNGFSTIAEIINSDHTPPQTQNLFRNTNAPDVKNLYGRTQIEPGPVWTTHFCGWYQTEELASPDSMYYTIEGTGGNGTIAVANTTMKMKGAKGGLGSLMNYNPGYFLPEQYPKGPAPLPAEGDDDDESPFSDMQVHVDFEKMAIIMSVHVEKEFSPGNGFKGDMTSVISLGAKKFWYFLAAGEGKIDNPVCEGKALFLAGINYTVPDSNKQLILDYSVSKRELPPEFNVMNGFFSQVAVVMPIPGAPNFSMDFGIGKLAVECTMGGEARLGLNFGTSTTFFFGVYATAWIKVDCEASITIIAVGVTLKAHLLVKAGAGGWFTYNSDAGASFDIKGFIFGKLDFEVCVTSFGAEACGAMTLFNVGGDIEGRLGAGEYMNITPTFEFLGLDI